MRPGPVRLALALSAAGTRTRGEHRNTGSGMSPGLPFLLARRQSASGSPEPKARPLRVVSVSVKSLLLQEQAPIRASNNVMTDGAGAGGLRGSGRISSTLPPNAATMRVRDVFEQYERRS